MSHGSLEYLLQLLGDTASSEYNSVNILVNATVFFLLDCRVSSQHDDVSLSVILRDVIGDGESSASDLCTYDLAFQSSLQTLRAMYDFDAQTPIFAPGAGQTGARASSSRGQLVLTAEAFDYFMALCTDAFPGRVLQHYLVHLNSLQEDLGYRLGAPADQRRVFLEDNPWFVSKIKSQPALEDQNGNVRSLPGLHALDDLPNVIGPLKAFTALVLHAVRPVLLAILAGYSRREANCSPLDFPLFRYFFGSTLYSAPEVCDEALSAACPIIHAKPAPVSFPPGPGAPHLSADWDRLFAVSQVRSACPSDRPGRPSGAASRAAPEKTFICILLQSVEGLIELLQMSQLPVSEEVFILLARFLQLVPSLVADHALLYGWPDTHPVIQATLALHKRVTLSSAKILLVWSLRGIFDRSADIRKTLNTDKFVLHAQANLGCCDIFKEVTNDVSAYALSDGAPSAGSACPRLAQFVKTLHSLTLDGDRKKAVQVIFALGLLGPESLHDGVLVNYFGLKMQEVLETKYLDPGFGVPVSPLVELAPGFQPLGRRLVESALQHLRFLLREHLPSPSSSAYAPGDARALKEGVALALMMQSHGKMACQRLNDVYARMAALAGRVLDGAYTLECYTAETLTGMVLEMAELTTVAFEDDSPAEAASGTFSYEVSTAAQPKKFAFTSTSEPSAGQLSTRIVTSHVEHAPVVQPQPSFLDCLRQHKGDLARILKELVADAPELLMTHAEFLAETRAFLTHFVSLSNLLLDIRSVVAERYPDFESIFAGAGLPDRSLICRARSHCTDVRQFYIGCSVRTDDVRGIARQNTYQYYRDLLTLPNLSMHTLLKGFSSFRAPLAPLVASCTDSSEVLLLTREKPIDGLSIDTAAKQFLAEANLRKLHSLESYDLCGVFAAGDLGTELVDVLPMLRFSVTPETHGTACLFYGTFLDAGYLSDCASLQFGCLASDMQASLTDCDVTIPTRYGPIKQIAAQKLHSEDYSCGICGYSYNDKPLLCRLCGVSQVQHAPSKMHHSSFDQMHCNRGSIAQEFAYRLLEKTGDHDACTDRFLSTLEEIFAVSRAEAETILTHQDNTGLHASFLSNDGAVTLTTIRKHDYAGTGPILTAASSFLAHGQTPETINASLECPTQGVGGLAFRVRDTASLNALLKNYIEKLCVPRSPMEGSINAQVASILSSGAPGTKSADGPASCYVVFDNSLRFIQESRPALERLAAGLFTEGTDLYSSVFCSTGPFLSHVLTLMCLLPVLLVGEAAVEGFLEPVNRRMMARFLKDSQCPSYDLLLGGYHKIASEFADSAGSSILKLAMDAILRECRAWQQHRYNPLRLPAEMPTTLHLMRVVLDAVPLKVMPLNLYNTLGCPGRQCDRFVVVAYGRRPTEDSRCPVFPSPCAIHLSLEADSK